MSETAIAFPHLGIVFDPVPRFIDVFGYNVAIYGIMISLAVIAGFSLAAFVAGEYGIDRDAVWDFALPAIVFSVIGARTYYVIMSWDSYKNDPISVFYLRQGGLAIYGGIIAGLITLFFYVKKKGISFPGFVDLFAFGLPLGQAIGRWGNFFNREAFGGYTDSFLAMRLPVDVVRKQDISEQIAAHMSAGDNFIQVHPTFLYESMWNILVLTLLLIFRKKRKFEGELFLLYVAGYGIGRFFIESLRTDQLLIPGTTVPVSMAVSALSAIAALIILVRKLKMTK